MPSDPVVPIVDPDGIATSPASAASRGTGRNRVRPMTKSIKGALLRYRVSANVVGWGLIILCVTIVMKYVFNMDWAVAIWGPIHGVLFIIYVLLAFDLAYKDRWSLIGTLKVLVSGVIPGVSFVTERWATRRVLARQRV